MTIIAQVAQELIEWNNKMLAGYEPSEIEQVYLDGLRQTFLKMLADK
jgi:hypothetical protein